MAVIQQFPYTCRLINSRSSGESPRLPPMYPGFDSELDAICVLSLLVLNSAPRGFYPGTLVFSSHQKLIFDGIVVVSFDL